MIPNILSSIQPNLVDSLSLIRIHTQSIVKNTDFDTIDWISFSVAVIALMVGVIALVYSHLTYFSQKRTESHTMSTETNTLRITHTSQKSLLVDMVRHLYRNFVVTYTLKTKLHHYGYRKCYPSEEHLVKLKTPVENIHLDAFYSKEELYQKMNNLYLLLRNYNTEIDVALMHLPQKDLDVELKKRDMSTLMFKPGFLVSKIVEILEEMCPEEDIPLLLAQVINKSYSGNQKRARGSEWLHDFAEYDNENCAFITSIFKRIDSATDLNTDFLTMFNRDVLIECGKNELESDKIYMIKFK